MSDTVTLDTIRQCLDILFIRNDIQFMECQKQKNHYCLGCPEGKDCEIYKAKEMIHKLYRASFFPKEEDKKEEENGTEQAQ